MTYWKLHWVLEPSTSHWETSTILEYESSFHIKEKGKKNVKPTKVMHQDLEHLIKPNSQVALNIEYQGISLIKYECGTIIGLRISI